MSDTQAGSTRGRPRSRQADDAILSTAALLLQERGYAGFSLDEVAARAGVAKTTIYRRWPAKGHLVVAVVAAMQATVTVPDTGDPHRDLRTLARGLAAGLTQPGIRELAGELIAASARDAELGAAFRKLWFDRREAVFAVLRRADVAEPELVADQLAGALWYRVLITGDLIDDSYAERVADAAMGRGR